jgi:signal transduction histidine kinase
MTGFRSSLAGRLIVWFIVVQSLLAVLALAVTLLAWPRGDDAYVFAHMSLAGQVARTLEAAPDGRPVLAKSPALERFRRERPHVRVAVFHEGRPVQGSAQELVAAMQGLGRSRITEATLKFTEGPLAGSTAVARQEPTRWGPVTVVATDNRLRLSDAPAVLVQLSGYLVRVMGFAVIGSVVLVPFVIRSALRPLDQASAEAALIDLRTRGLRLPESRGVPSELLTLVRSINAALERLDEGFSRQQRFAAQAAHEMRTPLAILAARIDGQPDQPFTEALRRDVDRMRKLVDQMLFAARLERGEVALDQPLDLVALVRQVVADCTPLALAEGRDLALVPDVETLPMVGGEQVVESAVVNVIHNAIRAERPGGTVEVVVRAPADVLVVDHGPGVPVDMRSRIFEPFWRGDERRPGAGLGLTIVREAVAAHGGGVWVETTPGGGATFHLRFAPMSAARRSPG